MRSSRPFRASVLHAAVERRAAVVCAVRQAGEARVARRLLVAHRSHAGGLARVARHARARPEGLPRAEWTAELRGIVDHAHEHVGAAGAPRTAAADAADAAD